MLNSSFSSSDPNGILLSYHLTVVDLDASADGDAAEISTPQQLIVESTVQQLEGLLQQRRYRIGVAATTKAGEGEENFVEVTSTVLVAPDPPTINLM